MCFSRGGSRGYQTNWQTVKIGNKWYGMSAAQVYDFETGRFLSKDPVPAIIKISLSGGKALGRFGRTGVAKSISIGANAGPKNYTKWFLNLYRAWSDSPVGQVDPNGLKDVDAQIEVTQNPGKANIESSADALKKSLENSQPNCTCEKVNEGGLIVLDEDAKSGKVGDKYFLGHIGQMGEVYKYDPNKPDDLAKELSQNMKAGGTLHIFECWSCEHYKELIQSLIKLGFHVDCVQKRIRFEPNKPPKKEDDMTPDEVSEYNKSDAGNDADAEIQEGIRRSQARQRGEEPALGENARQRFAREFNEGMENNSGHLEIDGGDLTKV